MSRYAKMMLLMGAAVVGVARCDESDDEWNAWLASGDLSAKAGSELDMGLKAGGEEFDAIVRSNHYEPSKRELQWARNYRATYSSYSYSFGDFSFSFGEYYSYGDMTDYPTSVPIPAPSAVPIPAPSASPSSVPIPAPSVSPSSVPIPAPSAVPVPAPSASPSTSPTVAAVPSPAPSPDVVVPVTVGLNIGLSGMTCAEYTTAEEDVMNKALASHIDGCDEDDFSDHTCSAARRLGEAIAASAAAKKAHVRGRSLLSSDAISLYTEVTVDATEFGDDDIMGSVLSAVNTAVSSGALASSISTYAAEAGISSMDSLAVTGVTVTTMTPTASPVTPVASPTASPVTPVASPTTSPTASPVAAVVVTTPSPTLKPTEEESLNGGGRAGASLTGLALVLGAIATLLP